MTADPRGSLSPLDDYPVHQTAEPMRRVATSDRNFYDRYYFNCYPSDDADMFLVVGLGQYPNLGVCDGFAVLRRGNDHIVVRASKALGTDRTDTAVGRCAWRCSKVCNDCAWCSKRGIPRPRTCPSISPSKATFPRRRKTRRSYGNSNVS